MADPISVLVVDDSATMRALISQQLRTDPGIRVVGEAADPLEAREAIKALNPDVVTLDIEMPNMNGLDFLERLMRLRPTPVVMVSTLTQRGAEATLEALELGAVDCVGKPVGASAGEFGTLCEKVHVAAGAKVRDRTPRPAASVSTAPYTPGDAIVAIGASTGGVEAILTLLSTFPANCPPTVITQHMPPSFTASFAARLDRSCAPRVSEATAGAPLSVGQVYLAPGGVAHLKVAQRSGGLVCTLDESALVSGHRPSVDVLFGSIARATPRAVGVILTGMGRDGAEGLLRMREAGASTFGQDEATSIVYGMPRTAHEIGAVQRQMPLNQLGGAVLRAASATPSHASKGNV